MSDFSLEKLAESLKVSKGGPYVEFTNMKKHFNDAEIVEISLITGMFNMINRLNDSFRTELESEEYNRRQHGAVGVTRATLEDYACRICAQKSS